MSKKGISLIEVLITSLIMVLVLIPTIDSLSSMVISQANYNNDVRSKQDNLNISERISTELKPGTYFYKVNLSLTIPTENSTIDVTIGSNSVATLIPKFSDDGSLSRPDSTTTSFTGIAFSVITESQWNGGSSSKYVLVETIFDNSSLNLIVDINDPLQIAADPPTDWNNGNSFVLSDNLKPGTFSTLGNMAFDINNTRNKVQFAFVPRSDAVYFPSDNGITNINDKNYLTMTNLKNWRDTTY